MQPTTCKSTIATRFRFAVATSTSIRFLHTEEVRRCHHGEVTNRDVKPILGFTRGLEEPDFVDLIK